MGLLLDRFVATHAAQTSAFGVTAAARGDLSNIPLYIFTQDEDRYVWYVGIVSRAYSGGNLELTIRARCDAAGDVVWEAAFERHVDGVTDLSLTTNFSTGVTATMLSPAGGFFRSVTFTVTAAQAGGIQAGESYRIRIGRLGTNVADTNTGFARLIGVELRNA